MLASLLSAAPHGPYSCQGSSAPFWSIYELFNWHFDGGLKIGGVMWSAMPRQVPQLIGLFAVVAFGSSLDVAAIQQDSPQPLDFNAELLTVGGLLPDADGSSRRAGAQLALSVACSPQVPAMSWLGHWAQE